MHRGGMRGGGMGGGGGMRGGGMRGGGMNDNRGNSGNDYRRNANNSGLTKTTIKLKLQIPSSFKQAFIRYIIIILHLLVNHSFRTDFNYTVTNSLNKLMVMRRHQYYSLEPD